MMPRWTHAATVATVVLLSACATTAFKVTAPRDQAATVTLQNGAPLLTSTATSSRASLMPSTPLKDYEDLVRFSLIVRNEGPKAIDVTAENIAVTANGLPAAVVLFEALAKRTNWRGVAADMAAAFSAGRVGSVGNSTATFTSSSTSTRTGIGKVSTETQGTISDPAAEYAQRQHEAADTAATAALVKADIAATKQALATSTFRSQTVEPGGTYSGFVYIQRPSGKSIDYAVRVKVGQDEHQFRLAESAIE